MKWSLDQPFLLIWSWAMAIKLPLLLIFILWHLKWLEKRGRSTESEGWRPVSKTLCKAVKEQQTAWEKVGIDPMFRWLIPLQMTFPCSSWLDQWKETSSHSWVKIVRRWPRPKPTPVLFCKNHMICIYKPLIKSSVSASWLYNAAPISAPPHLHLRNWPLLYYQGLWIILTDSDLNSADNS